MDRGFFFFLLSDGFFTDEEKERVVVIGYLGDMNVSIRLIVSAVEALELEVLESRSRWSTWEILHR